jgi:uncharacterized OsmC-like protein
MSTIDVREMLRPLRARYKEDPDSARYTYRVRASGDSSDPRRATVESIGHPGATWAVSINEKLGGEGVLPTPGDLMLAAWAACKTLAVQMAAAGLRIPVRSVEVMAWGDVDHRGPMFMPGAVRVGSESMRCRVRILVEPGTDEALLDKLKFAAEATCGVTDNILHETPMETAFEIIEMP